MVHCVISAFYATCVIAILYDVHVYQAVAQIFTAQSMRIQQHMPWLSNYPNPPHFWHVHVRYMLSPVRLSVICLSSVTFVRPTQPAEIFCNVSMPFGALAICWHPRKILRRSSLGNPSVKGFKPNIAILNPSKTISQKQCKLGGKLVLMTNKKSYMNFRLVPKLVNDLEPVSYTHLTLPTILRV